MIPISEFRLCYCGRGEWQVTEIEIDDGVEERIRTLVSPKYRKRFLRELKEGKLSSKIYIVHRRCGICGFIPPPKLVTSRMLKKEQK
jgi:hypothetical protein